MPIAILLTAAACVIADASWFYLGQLRGNRILGFLCKVSLEPDSCIRRAQNVFTRYGLSGIAVAKFIPGMSTIAPPLAGMSGVHFFRFLVADVIGSLLYGTAFLSLGYVFSNQIEQIGSAISNIGGSAISLMLGLILLYVAYRFWQRPNLLRELRTARITVAELRSFGSAKSA